MISCEGRQEIMTGKKYTYDFWYASDILETITSCALFTLCVLYVHFKMYFIFHNKER